MPASAKAEPTSPKTSLLAMPMPPRSRRLKALTALAALAEEAECQTRIDHTAPRDHQVGPRHLQGAMSEAERSGAGHAALSLTKRAQLRLSQRAARRLPG